MMIGKDGMFQIIDYSVVANIPQDKAVTIMSTQLSREPVYVPHGHFGCAMVARRNERSIFMMYIAPSRRRPIMYESGERGNIKTVQLWLPHVYLAVTFRRNALQGAYAFMTHNKIRSSSDMMTHAPLPNIEQNGQVCNGSASFETNISPEENSERYVRFFLTSHFSHDITRGFESLPADFGGGRTGGSNYEATMKKWGEVSLTKTRDQALDLFTGIRLTKPVGETIDGLLGR